MKLIDLYKSWLMQGIITRNGLCNSLPSRYKRQLMKFYPTADEWKNFNHFYNRPQGYWGHNGEVDLMSDRARTSKEFSPLRQTIVLLICAMNNEL